MDLSFVRLKPEENESKKQILYFDMDNVLVDFKSGIEQLDEKTKVQFKDDLDEVPGIFALMDPLPDAIESFEFLSQLFDTYILSTAPWKNATAWSDKLDWVKKHLGKNAYKRLILTHHKNLNKGDFLIDDRTKNGADKFEGELIAFGSAEYPNWQKTTEYMYQQWCDSKKSGKMEIEKLSYKQGL